MDFNYSVKSMVLSLMDRCATQLARKALEEFEVALRDRFTRDAVEAKAISRIKELEVPDDYKNLIEAFVKPLVDELCVWYNLGRPGKAVLTHQGTLDLSKSIKIETESEDDKSKLDNVNGIRQNDRYRYFIALQLANTNRRLKCSWHAVHRGDPVTFTYSSPEDRELHIKYLKEADIRSYRKQAGSAALPFNEIPEHEASLRIRGELDHTPEMLCYFFSKLNQNTNTTEIQRDDLMSKLLFLLLKWPYQRFFSDASRVLIPSIAAYEYCTILCYIVQKMNNGYKDWKYRDMFIKFWNLGKVHRENTASCAVKMHQVALEIFVCKDIFLVRFYTDRISSEFKKTLLLYFYSNNICLILLHKDMLERLELFIKCCGMENIPLLMKFKNKFKRCYEKEFEKRYSFHVRFYGLSPLSEVEWKDRLSKMAGIVDKIISEIPTE